MSFTVNGGTLDINGGTFHGHNYQGTTMYQYSIQTASDSVININDGTFTNGDITNASGATMNIYGGTIDDGYINNYGVMNIGDNTNAIDKTTPTISSDKQDTDCITNSGTLNFYDGTLTYLKTPIIGNIDNIPTNSQVIYERSGNNHIYYISSTDVVATIGNTEYTTLDAAFAAVTGSNHTQIDMQKSVAQVKGHEFTIDSTKDIALNLNGKTIIGNCEDVFFTNEGTFEIADTTGGAITVYGAGLADNTGDLTISGGTLTLDLNTTTRTLVKNTGTGSVTVTGGELNVQGYYEYRVIYIDAYCIYSTSTGNITVTGGKFTAIGKYSDYRGYNIYVSSASTKPNVTFGGNANITSQGESYGFYFNNVNLNVTGGTNSCTSKGNVIQNTTGTISGGIIEGGTSIDASSTVTISGNSTQVGAIANYGTVTVNGGTLTGQFENRNMATFNGGKISTSDSNSLYLNSNQTVNISSGFEIENKAERTDAYGINIANGICNVAEGVTVTADYGTGIYISYGTLNLGLKARPVNTASPTITGAVNGINHRSGTFNFYDGIITGTGSGALGGTAPNDLPDGFTVQTANNGTVAWLESSAIASDVAVVNNVRYKSLQSAINATTTGVITIVDNITLDSPVVIQNGKNIVIDLSSYRIEYAGADAVVENNGTLTIVDGNEDGTDPTEYSMIKNTVGPAIQNNGTLTIGSDADSAVYTNSPRIVGGTYAVVNNSSATFKFYDGILKGVTAAVDGTITNTTSISGYTLTDGTDVDGGVTYHTKYYN